MIRVALLPGDGVGEEVLEGPARLLRRLAEQGLVAVTGPWPVGARAAASQGSVLPPATLEACDAADALLLGAVGDDPRVPPELCPRPELALHQLRERYDLRISVRQIPVDETNVLTVVRNLIGGSYGGRPDRQESVDGGAAHDVLRLTPERVAEVVHLACDIVDAGGGGRLLSVDKANLYATGRLWRRVATEVAGERGIAVEHRYVDRAAFELGAGAEVPAVLVTEGLLGDILSDLAAGRAGSPALCGSASVHPGAPASGRCVGLFEPAHGSAPRRALRQQVNPLGGFLALVALLQHFDPTREAGERLQAATRSVLRSGPWTYDLAPAGTAPASTTQVADAVLAAYDSPRAAAPPRPAGSEPLARVPADELERWTLAVLQAVGVRAEHAADTARVLAYADLAGIDSHGIARLPAYVKALRSGLLRTGGEPSVRDGGGPVALVDGHHLLGHPVSRFALGQAVARAREHGVGWVNVRNSSHHGATGAYVHEAALQGLVALAATNTGPVVAPTGAFSPYLGTNPIAIGVPVAGEPPVVLDMATSAVSGGKFELALRSGTDVPLGWGVDGAGLPTTDPTRVYPGKGALLPLGSDRQRSSHKGYGLALVVELLTAVLSGGPTGPGVGNLTFRAAAAHPSVSHLLVVLDPARLGDSGDAAEGAERLLHGLRALAPLDDAVPVRTPGERAAQETERRRRGGIPLDRETSAALQALAAQLDLPLGTIAGG